MRAKLLLGAIAALIAPAAHSAPSAAEVAQGGNLFLITCSSSFCHGEGAVGARGPALKNRNLPPDFIRNTVLNGRSGTAMPAFKGSLSQPELEMIVGYVMSLSPNNHAEDTGPMTPAPVQAPPLSAKAEAGKAIFFDLTKAGGCALCHSYNGYGGPVGPDLNGIAKRTPRDIYQAIVKPTVPNADYTMVSVATADGMSVTGLLKGKTDASVQIYDLSSAPPVLRSLYGAKMGPAYLKSADPASKDVTPQDLAQPEGPK
jgi:putative heme-binding domain-containing protein